jgi:hypothetical protein
MKIRTEFQPNLTPNTRSVWTAVDDDSYDGEPSSPHGFGFTEAEAIADLLEQMAERD